MLARPRSRLVDADPPLRALRKLLPRHLGRDSRVLDVGCGEGVCADELAACAAGPVAYTGLDPDADACAAARERLRQLSSALVDAQILPLSLQEFTASRADEFDLVLFVRTLHECVPSDEPQALASVAAAAAAHARPGGRVLVSDPVLEEGLPAAERERITAYDARVARGSSAKPHLTAAAIEAAFMAAGLRVLERSLAPRFALGAYLGVSGARQLLIVFERPAH